MRVQCGGRAAAVRLCFLLLLTVVFLLSGRAAAADELPVKLQPGSPLRLGDDLYLPLTVESAAAVEGRVCAAAYSADNRLLALRWQEVSLSAGDSLSFSFLLENAPLAARAAAFFLAADGSLTPYAAMQTQTRILPGVPLRGLTLLPDALLLHVGEQAALEPRFQPADASLRGLTWQSSDEAVAVVHDGMVRALTPGQAQISARSFDGKHLASAMITVSAPPEQPAVTTGAAASERPFCLALSGTFDIPAGVVAEYGFCWWQGSAARPATAARVSCDNVSTTKRQQFDGDVSLPCAPGNQYYYCAYLRLWEEASGWRTLWGEPCLAETPSWPVSALEPAGMAGQALLPGTSAWRFTPDASGDYTAMLAGDSQAKLTLLDEDYQLIAETAAEAPLRVACAAGAVYYFICTTERGATLSLREKQLPRLRAGEPLVLELALDMLACELQVVVDADGAYELEAAGEAGGAWELRGSGAALLDGGLWYEGTERFSVLLDTRERYTLVLQAYGPGSYTLTLTPAP